MRLATHALFGVRAVALFHVAVASWLSGADRISVATYGPHYASNGFVFIDNEYIDAPYCVSNNGFDVLINGRVVERIALPPARVTIHEPPALPTNITATTSLFDPSVEAYISALHLFLWQTHANSHAAYAARLIAEIGNIPCIKNVAPDSDFFTITIESHQGETYPLGLDIIEYPEDACFTNDVELFATQFSEGLARG